MFHLKSNFPKFTPNSVSNVQLLLLKLCICSFNISLHTDSVDSPMSPLLIKEICVGAYHRGGHGDVEKLPSPSLRDCSGEEKLVSILVEEWRFILQRQKNMHVWPKVGAQTH